ncbi:hypothetical protein [Marinoscillum furvescens]|uniref:Uncharacterized protein n=1 Tax=Marinoscillum furvescens DSM 4134 TaxID=1122208 RepID=A0A3D9L4E8_MARFU|nr:hypothetical protein [Marinoscillum furvescens]RED99807.1 hypothetical protein C7460_10789 [Marinoscillum furvescens DSM 4134]
MKRINSYIVRKNKDYYTADPIPLTNKNFKKALRLSYKRLLYLPVLLTLVIGFFVLPLIVFRTISGINLTLSLGISASIFFTMAILGPYLQIKLAFYNAKRNPKNGLRKHGILENMNLEK